jgi:hypothetical protein
VFVYAQKILEPRAEVAKTNAETTYDRTQYDYQRALAELEFATG